MFFTERVKQLEINIVLTNDHFHSSNVYGFDISSLYTYESLRFFKNDIRYINPQMSKTFYKNMLLITILPTLKIRIIPLTFVSSSI